MLSIAVNHSHIDCLHAHYFLNFTHFITGTLTSFSMLRVSRILFCPQIYSRSVTDKPIEVSSLGLTSRMGINSFPQQTHVNSFDKTFRCDDKLKHAVCKSASAAWRCRHTGTSSPSSLRLFTNNPT